MLGVVLFSPSSSSFAVAPLSSPRPRPATTTTTTRFHSHLTSSPRKLLRSSHRSASLGPIPIPQPSSPGAEVDKWDPSDYDALLRGGEQVTSVLQEMITLLEDMDMDEASEAAAVEIAAQGVIGKRVDEMESGFMMALDYMIQIADKDGDDKVHGKNLSNRFLIWQPGASRIAIHSGLLCIETSFCNLQSWWSFYTYSPDS